MYHSLGHLFFWNGLSRTLAYNSIYVGGFANLGETNAFRTAGEWSMQWVLDLDVQHEFRGVETLSDTALTLQGTYNGLEAIGIISYGGEALPNTNKFDIAPGQTAFDRLQPALRRWEGGILRDGLAGVRGIHYNPVWRVRKRSGIWGRYQEGESTNPRWIVSIEEEDKSPLAAFDFTTPPPTHADFTMPADSPVSISWEASEHRIGSRLDLQVLNADQEFYDLITRPRVRICLYEYDAVVEEAGFGNYACARKWQGFIEQKTGYYSSFLANETLSITAYSFEKLWSSVELEPAGNRLLSAEEILKKCAENTPEGHIYLYTNFPLSFGTPTKHPLLDVSIRLEDKNYTLLHAFDALLSFWHCTARIVDDTIYLLRLDDLGDAQGSAITATAYGVMVDETGYTLPGTQSIYDVGVLNRRLGILPPVGEVSVAHEQELLGDVNQFEADVEEPNLVGAAGNSVSVPEVGSGGVNVLRFRSVLSSGSTSHQLVSNHLVIDDGGELEVEIELAPYDVSDGEEELQVAIKVSLQGVEDLSSPVGVGSPRATYKIVNLPANEYKKQSLSIFPNRRTDGSPYPGNLLDIKIFFGAEEGASPLLGAYTQGYLTDINTESYLQRQVPERTSLLFEVIFRCRINTDLGVASRSDLAGRNEAFPNYGSTHDTYGFNYPRAPLGSFGYMFADQNDVSRLLPYRKGSAGAERQRFDYVRRENMYLHGGAEGFSTELPSSRLLRSRPITDWLYLETGSGLIGLVGIYFGSNTSEENIAEMLNSHSIDGGYDPNMGHDVLSRGNIISFLEVVRPFSFYRAREYRRETPGFYWDVSRRRWLVLTEEADILNHIRSVAFFKSYYTADNDFISKLGTEFQFYISRWRVKSTDPVEVEQVDKRLSGSLSWRDALGVSGSAGSEVVRPGRENDYAVDQSDLSITTLNPMHEANSGGENYVDHRNSLTSNPDYIIYGRLPVIKQIICDAIDWADDASNSTPKSVRAYIERTFLRPTGTTRTANLYIKSLQVKDKIAPYTIRYDAIDENVKLDKLQQTIAGTDLGVVPEDTASVEQEPDLELAPAVGDLRDDLIDIHSEFPYGLYSNVLAVRIPDHTHLYSQWKRIGLNLVASASGSQWRNRGEAQRYSLLQWLVRGVFTHRRKIRAMLEGKLHREAPDQWENLILCPVAFQKNGLPAPDGLANGDTKFGFADRISLHLGTGTYAAMMNISLVEYQDVAEYGVAFNNGWDCGFSDGFTLCQPERGWSCGFSDGFNFCVNTRSFDDSFDESFG